VTPWNSSKGEAAHYAGAGISPEQMEGLFDPGFTKKGKRVRAGMGLLVASNIVKNHHGRIEVESEPGEGSTFTVVLPMDAGQKRERSPSRQHRPSDATG